MADETKSMTKQDQQYWKFLKSLGPTTQHILERGGSMVYRIYLGNMDDETWNRLDAQIEKRIWSDP